jgi:transcriptional regulator with XRE-family HTH domain
MGKGNEQLRRVREEAGLSQEALARAADVSTGTIQALELGATSFPRVDTARRIAEALDSTIDEIFPTDDREREGVVS